MPDYDFCITRTSAASIEKFHGRIRFGDLDPGKEVARAYAVNKYKTATSTGVSATDFDEAVCGGDVVEEVEIASLDGDLVARISERAAAGDVTGAALFISEATVAVPIRTLQGAAQAAGGVVDAVRDWFRRRW